MYDSHCSNNYHYYCQMQLCAQTYSRILDLLQQSISLNKASKLNSCKATTNYGKSDIAMSTRYEKVQGEHFSLPQIMLLEKSLVV